MSDQFLFWQAFWNEAAKWRLWVASTNLQFNSKTNKMYLNQNLPKFSFNFSSTTKHLNFKRLSISITKINTKYQLAILHWQLRCNPKTAHKPRYHYSKHHGTHLLRVHVRWFEATWPVHYSCTMYILNSCRLFQNASPATFSKH